MTDLPPPVPGSVPAAPATRVVELPYHRLYRANPTYAWWRPLVAVIVAAAAFLLVSTVLAVIVMVVLIANGTLSLETASSPEELTELLLPDMAQPWTLVFGLGSIIAVLPFVPLALRIAGIRPAGPRLSVLHSVLFRLRWRWLFDTLAWSALLWTAITAVQLGIGFATGEQLAEFSLDAGTYLVSLVLVLLLVPVQAATEEYLYRGVLLQSIGSWVRVAAVAIVLSTLAFAFSHAYDVWGIVQVAIMGAGLAIVTIRTGGLEAAISLHTVNNIGTFAIIGTGVFSGGETGMSTETGGPIGVIGQVVTLGLWMLLIEWRARRAGVDRVARVEVPASHVVPGAREVPSVHPAAPGMP